MKKIIFDEKLKSGYFTADYFKKTSEILKMQNNNPIITMQFFQRNNNVVLCGIEEVLQLLKFACPNFNTLKIWSLNDGDIINQFEPVLKIEGKYVDFGWLEGIIDGILARNTSIATNSRNVVNVANGIPILNMMDRADKYNTLETDGYASYIGGIKLFVTQASVSLIDDNTVPNPSGTMPHALIQAFEGDLIKATEAFYDTFPNNNLLSLIDYNNDCVRDAAKVAKHFGQKLWAVRIDTSSALVDKYLQEHKSSYPLDAQLNGVNHYLVEEVRKALDDNGCEQTKIIVSSGINEKSIEQFKAMQTPIDIYGVGAALANINIGFTGDAVLLNGKKEAKFGRNNVESARLARVK